MGVHPFDCPAPAKPAQVPRQIRLGRDVEHHLWRSEAAHHAAREGLVSVDLLRLGDDDRMIVDIYAALSQTGAQISDTTRAITLLDAPRRLGRFANAAVDQPLEADLRVIVHVRPSDIDIEKRRDVVSMLRLDTAGNVTLH